MPLMRMLIGVVAATIMAKAALAGPWEEGWQAYDNGDFATALHLWEPLAERGFTAVQVNVGSMYATGTGVTKDDVVAAEWYRRAAEQGFPIAQFNLGAMYERGIGVPRDEAEAAHWYGLAAEQGNADAQYNLALMYGRGKGVAQDFLLAYTWFSVAAAQGDAAAAWNRDLTEELLTSDQLDYAQSLSDKLIQTTEIATELR